MAETPFTIELPDGSDRTIYSPSSVVAQFLSPGATLTVSQFLPAAIAALTEANNRVRERFGVG
ncbi:MAG: hypothetical protein Q7Q71_04835 [Verrucomicrobiota bacterium JB023]|nr:hypothetical protein [Verrucomicrobiota bacterium JB023]